MNDVTLDRATLAAADLPVRVDEFVPAEHRAVLEDSAQHLEQRLR